MTEEASKVCSKCKTSKSLCDFGKSASSKDKLSYYCKQCTSAMSRNYRNNNLCNVKERERLQRIKTKEYRREKAKLWKRDNRSALGDFYIAHALKLNLSDLPPAIIELKRQQLAIHRMSKELKRNANESSKNPG